MKIMAMKHRNVSSWITTATIAFFSLAIVNVARSEVFTMNNGVVVTAEWLNSGDQSATSWKLRQSNGVELEIPRGMVKSVLSPIPAAVPYINNIDKVDDNVEAHRKIIDWCVKQGLMLIADAHRDRLVELDPSDKTAWSALGYTETSNGWIRKDTYWKRKGMQSKGGRWRFPQDIAFDERQLAAKVQMSELNRKIDQAIRDVKTESKRASVSRQYLQDLNDPLAIPKLRELMVADRKNSDPQFRLIMIEMIARMKTSSATITLVDAALFDPNDQVVNHCIEILSQSGTELAINNFLERVTNQNPNRDSATVINRAARALSVIGDERCIPKLIDCLVTKHFVVPAPQPGTQATQTSDGAVNFAPNGNKKLVEIRSQNPDVLAALQSITGESTIQYDRDEWLNWYAANFAPSRPDVYRDP